MKTILGLSGRWAVFLLVPIVIVGCGGKSGVKSESDLDLGPTVGSVAQVAPAAPMQVEGYGLVVGLPGTGSPSCPPELRTYLKRYIPMQMPERSVNVDSFIESNTTAVVRLEGMIPSAVSKRDRFDVKVTALPGSGTLSLQGGWLPKSELHVRGTFGGAVKPLATVEGGVYINAVGEAEPTLTAGYVLGGARSLHDYVGALTLRKPDFLTASAIRNRLSERYGPRTARTASPSIIELKIPSEYEGRKTRFLAMVSATFLVETAQSMPVRINTMVERLAASKDKEGAEIALEALGRDCLTQLRSLLSSGNEEVRLRAARCMLYLRDDEALKTLRTIALDKNSPYRAEAFEAVAKGAQRNDAMLLAKGLLQDGDKAMVLAAYEYLRRSGDPAIEQEFIGRSFYLEQVAGVDRKAIFVSRSGVPRVVIFGGPLTCDDNLFIESANGRVVANSRAGQAEAFVMCKDSTTSGMIGPIKTSRGLSDMIRVLGAERRSDAGPAGLGVPYADVAAFLEQMCAKEAVAAEFWPGPLPKIGPIVKK